MKLGNKKWMFLVLLVIFLSGCVLFLSKKIENKNNPKKELVDVIKIDTIEDIKGLGYSGQRKVAIDSKGNIFVAYRKKYLGRSEIFVAKIVRENGGWNVIGTEKPIAIIGKNVDQRVPSIAIDNKDNIHVVWYGSDSDAKKNENNRQVKYSKSSDGGENWSDWKNISQVDGYEGEDYWQEHPYIMTSNEKELFVVWEGKDKNNKKQQIKFSKSLDGGSSWEEWKNVNETGSNTQSRPTIVQESSGKLHLLAYSSFGNDNNKQRIVHSWSLDGGKNWSSWEPISDQAIDSRHLSVNIDNNNKLNLVWRGHALNEKSNIFYKYLSNDSWSEAVKVAESENYQFFPNVVIVENGNVFVTWMESRNESTIPNEDPIDGRIHAALIKEDRVVQSSEISDGEINLYPNVPMKNHKGLLALVYESGKESSNKFSIILRVNRI